MGYWHPTTDGWSGCALSWPGSPARPLLRSRGAGAILRFERVRPRRRGAFQPLRENEITPQFLDRAIRALKRWKL